MEDTLVIDSVDKLKVYADPLRQRLLQAFCCNPATTKQIAQNLGEKPTRLYHHIELLEQAGYLVVVETRQVRGTIEKYYETAARKIIVDHSLVGSIEEAEKETDLQVQLINTLQAGLVDARDHFTAGKAMAIQAQLRLNETNAAELFEKLEELLSGYQDSDTSEPAQGYAVSLVVFPIIDKACC